MANIPGMKGERIICRLYIRHRCNRGDMCPFYHPGYSLPADNPTMTWLTFCNNFKTGRCFQQDCKYFHITSEEEETYKRGRDIAPALLEQAMRKALLYDVALTGTRATCKAFLQGGCTVSNCPFRHISRHEFADEVLNTLRNEFEIVLGPGTDIPGSQQIPSMPQGGGVIQPLMMNPLIPPPVVLRGQGDPDDYVRKLENENHEIWRALDPEQKASSLEEIRERLLTLQAALQWKDEEIGSRAEGFVTDRAQPIIQMPAMNFANPEPLLMQPFGSLMPMMDMTPMPLMDMTPMPLMDMNPMPLEADKQVDVDTCKLFIGGLDSATETSSLINYFSRWGEIVDAIVMRDKNNKARGFGFVTYLNGYMAEDAVNSGPHRIDGKIVDAKFAQSRPESSQRSGSDRRGPQKSPERAVQGKPYKLFVGGLSEAVDTITLETYFERYGQLLDAVSMQDVKTKRPRGFGFVEFATEESMEDVLADCPHMICGVRVTVQRPMPRENDKSGASARRGESSGGGRGSGGGGGGGRGRQQSYLPGEPCKMFVGGINPNTKESALKEYFSQFAEVESVNIQKDQKKQSKGYGFVLFTQSHMVDDVLESGPHMIDGRRVDVGHAARKTGSTDRDRDHNRQDSRREKSSSSGNEDCKLYLGNLHESITEEDIREHFMQYGDIEKVEIKQLTKNKRIFAFVFFSEPEMVDAALRDTPHQINGITLTANYSDKKGNRDGRRDGNARRTSNRDKDNDSDDGSPQTCKLFIGNLSYESTEESLYDYFCKYGEITETKVNTDSNGVSRGYGFVTFADEMSGREALDDGPHEIDNKEVCVASAVERDPEKREIFKRRYDRESSDEPPSLTSKRMAEKRSHLD